jgi:uncharacterized membrane protein
MRTVGPGHVLFAMAVAGIAVLNLTFGDFAPIWQPALAWIPERIMWVYGSGLLLLLASAGICFERTASLSAGTIGAYLAVWTLTRAAPIFSEPLSVGSWYGIFEALGPFAGAWILYALLRRQGSVAGTPFIASERAVRSAQIVFGLACIVYGLAHFAYADYTASMVPTWLPGRLGSAYLTGVGHVAAGVGIMVGILPRLAATLEAIMMSLFGLLVWLPSLFAQPPPKWAMPPQNQWSEIIVTLLLAASAWIVADSLQGRPWGFRSRSVARRNAARG